MFGFSNSDDSSESTGTTESAKGTPTANFADEFDDEMLREVEAGKLDEPEQPVSEYLPDGHQYRVRVTEREFTGGKQITSQTVNNGPIAGKYAREVWESARFNPEKEFWFGYDETGHGGFDAAPIRHEAMRKHVWISGTTGSGKTTFLQNKAVHHAYAGHGFCHVDPKADGDTIDLLRSLPGHRLEDVVFLEPGSAAFDRNIGINMLDMPPLDDDMEREKEIESRLQNLTAIFHNDEYWGPTMAAVTESMGRAMLKHNAEVAADPTADSSEKYSIIDMFFILLNQERREEFAADVSDPYVSEFLESIAEMDDEKLWPLLKRIKRWVENGVVRKIIAERDSSINWDRIVDEGKILLVRIPVDNEDVHQMITLTVLRNLWSAKKRQVRDPDREKEPYFLHLDEFEKVANDNLAMEDMLVRARSFWLSVTIGTQYPGQIGESHPKTLRAMDNNCNTILSMRTPGREDANILMSNYDGYDNGDLQSLDAFRVWTKVLLEGGKEGDPVNVKTFPPYPPLWEERQAQQAIEHSLELYGTPTLSEQQIRNELKFGHIGDLVNPAAAMDGEAPEDMATDAEMVLDMVPEDVFLEAIFSAQVQHADTETAVPKSFVEEELEKRVGDVGFSSEISNAFEANNMVKREGKRDGELAVSLTDHGLNTVLSHDTGSSASGGGDDHRRILNESYQVFTRLGALTSLPTQEGDELPDGVADLPHQPLEEAETFEEAEAIRNEMIDEYPCLWALSNGRDISIEAETSTIKKPQQTLTNLRKAIEAERTCIFTCKDATSDDTESHGITYWPERGEKVIYDTDGQTVDYSTITCVSETFDTGERVFYNMTNKLRFDSGNRIAVAPDHDDHQSLVWREQGNVIAVVSKRSGSDDKTITQFSDPELAVDPPAGTTLHREKVNDKWVVKTGEGDDAEVEDVYDDLDALQEDYIDLYEPFIPDVEFPRPVEDDDFAFMVFPDDDNDDHNEPVIVDHGRTTKLSAYATKGEPKEEDPRSAAGDQSSEPDESDTTNASDPTDTQQRSADPTPEEESSPDPAVSSTETPPPEATINPHELTDELDSIDIGILNTWASGTALPRGEGFEKFVDAVGRVNPKAADYLDRPEDIPTVMGVGTAGSESCSQRSGERGDGTGTEKSSSEEEADTPGVEDDGWLA